MKEPLSLQQYKSAELKNALADGRRGLLIHAWTTVAVVAALIVINILVASEFPWSVFPAVGMSIGVAFHYFGIRHVADDVARRQSEVEAEASRLSA